MSDGAQLKEGTIFAGDYKVIRPLRSGGQGSLYVVEQLSTSKPRALKLLLPELVAQPSSRKRFELEAKIAARIQSDHIVESIASGVDAKTGFPWLVMELLEGEDLSAHIQKKRHLPAAEVLEIFDQLCHALGEAHKQGIVHRDLKPENIFLATSRRRGLTFMVKVLDFGIARVMAEAKTQSGATVTGLGTPMWMSPEQTIPGGRVEPATDVWPLGLIAFRLLTGYLFWKAPYDPGASVLMLMAEAFMHPLPTASARAAEYRCEARLPPGFDDWFARCVARDMDQRYPDASAAFTALEPILAAFVAASVAQPGGAASTVTMPLPATPPTGPTPPPTTGPTKTGPSAIRTGPGRATWEGAPEMAAEAVVSVSDSQPVSPPSATSGGTHTPTPTAEHAPPVQTTAIPASVAPPRSRLTTVIVGSCLAGVLIGAGLFAWSRGKGPASPATGGAITTATPTPIVEARALASSPSGAPSPSSAPSPSGAPSSDDAGGAPGETATAAPTDSSATTSPGAASASLGGRRAPKLCKAAGLKCFSNDDCCDRLCRQWTCRANQALHDPYANDKK